jgi:VIT1/CCC1 family predicted Fe2+/Mn2+ transporter
MESFSDQEQTRITNAINDIYRYKKMLARGYLQILRGSTESRASELLLEIQEHEEQDADVWLQYLNDFPGSDSPTPRLPDWQSRMMMSILGKRGFLEWALIAEDESVGDLLTFASLLEDRKASEKWLRIAADERKHIETIKERLLGMESWEMSGGGGVRDVIFGANDGLVSILALVAGVYGAITENSIILLTGVAGAIAGTVSMGAGAYISAKSEQEVMKKERRRKGLPGNLDIESEIVELTAYFQEKGFRSMEANAIAQRVVHDAHKQDQIAIGEIVGITSADEWPPSKAGLLTGLSFLVASIVPLLPFTFLSSALAAVVAAVASILALFAIGASKAVFTRCNWVRSGLEMMAIGSSAAIVTYIIGSVLGV